MKYLIIIIGIIISLFNFPIASAKQVYNCIEDKWETVPDKAKWRLKYNLHTDKWSYQPKEATVEINPYSETWDWDSGHGNEENEEDEESDWFDTENC